MDVSCSIITLFHAIAGPLSLMPLVELSCANSTKVPPQVRLKHCPPTFHTESECTIYNSSNGDCVEIGHSLKSGILTVLYPSVECHFYERCECKKGASRRISYDSGHRLVLPTFMPVVRSYNCSYALNPNDHRVAAPINMVLSTDDR